MEVQSSVAMAVSPCSLSRSLPLLTPRLASYVSCSASFFSSPLHARWQQSRGIAQPSAQLAQSYADDFREPPTVRHSSAGEPKYTFSKVLHESNKEQSVMLRFVWLEKNLGLALDQVIPGYGTIPLTPYYFLPQKDVVGELEKFIESQGWISRNRTSAILRQAAELISLWQQKSA